MKPENRPFFNFDHIQDAIEVFFLLQTAESAYHEGQRRGLPIGIVNAPEDVLADEHLRARGFFVEVDAQRHHWGVAPLAARASQRSPEKISL